MRTQVLVRPLHLVLVLVFLLSWIPTAPVQAYPSTVSPAPVAAQSEEPPLPEPLAVTPIEPRALPSLLLDIDVSPDPLPIGGTATFVVTISNQSEHPAEDVVLTVPVPPAVRALKHQALNAGEWRWELGRLDPQASTEVSAKLLLTEAPTGDALLLRPEATARNLDLPVATVGGALTVAENRAPVQVAVEAQRSATLLSEDNRVEVVLPEQASNESLTLDLAPLEMAAASRATTNATVDQDGFEPFVLTATDEAGRQVESFAKDMTINVSYTPEQLAALGISEGDLTLFRYDEEAQTWLPLTTEVDRDTLTATASGSDVGTFSLASDWEPSDAYLPSLQGFQVGMFTGGASYNYPIDLPAGPGGIRPELTLSYNSGATDGESGLRPDQQAGWVGRGWSLDTGALARRKLPTGGEGTIDHLVLTLNGQSFDFMRGAALVTDPSDRRLWDWQWLPTDENFMRLQAFEMGLSIPNQRGGTNQFGVLNPRYGWKVWTTDGTLYEFTEDLWWGFCAGNDRYTEPYRWLLQSVTDTQGNVITYHYDRQSVSDWAEPDETCAPLKGTLDADAWPTEITWGRNENVSGSVDRFRVSFRSEERQGDKAFKESPGQFRGKNAQPQETRRLLGLDVWSKPEDTWERIWGYNFTTDYSLYPDDYSCVSKCGEPDQVYGPNPDPQYRKLTLTAIQRYGKDGTTGLPATTFTYETNRGTEQRALGGWNRLKTVDNGQGGVITLSYDHIAREENDNQFFNYHRLKTRVVSDGRGNEYTWRYRYGSPAMNTLGTQLGGTGPQEYPNSAVLYFNKKRYPQRDDEIRLVHKPGREFRGHSSVAEQDPSGAETEHFFYQGDADCVPTKAWDQIPSDPCFHTIRGREILKGRAHMVRRRDAPGGANYQETRYLFGIEFDNELNYRDYGLSGLWRAFSYEREVREYQYERGNTPVQKTTVYEYRESYQNHNDLEQKAQFGNLTHIHEYLGDSNGTLVRSTERSYIAKTNANTYITDRLWGETVSDGSGKLLSLTHWFYDGATVAENPASLGRGNLTMERQYFNVPQMGCCDDITLKGRDISYDYDTYGNQTTTTTYTGYGTLLNGSYSEPGKGSIAWAITTTTYDSIFHVYPTKVVNPLGHTETAGYDWRMGTMTRVTNVNNHSTTAEYDVFGRVVKVVKPGDSSASPTLEMLYYDTRQPVQYIVKHREQTAIQYYRPTQEFYDGLGRLIQSKEETINAAQNSVVDYRYDGVGNQVAQSQPRHVNETPTTGYWRYTTPGSSLYRPTTTTYDALNRPLKITSTDGSSSEHHYGIENGLLYDDIIDQNRHRTQYQTDALGRLRKVVELSGNCAQDYWQPTYSCSGAYTAPWSTHATTRYDYDAMDRLTKVTDEAGNITTTTYDSAGRKTQMNDPDMGIWQYTYYTNGGLKTQLDAQGQQIYFIYDELDRLRQKRIDRRLGIILATYRYDEAHAGNGIGRRTSASTPDNSSKWYYDARGRKTRADHVVADVTRTFRWAYDSADRVVAITYPNGEEVRYRYDAGWRPERMTSSKVGTLVQSATYTALHQPDRWTFGHNVAQDWDYDSMARVNKLAVSNRFDRRYSYDKVGNVTQIRDARPDAVPLQKYGYDHRDRLVRWEWGTDKLIYRYDAIGNLTHRSGIGDYGYPAAGSPRPHAPTTVGGQPYQYDANGNTLSGGGRTYTWTIEHLPLTIKGTDGFTERYSYNVDGERVKKIRMSTSTIYLEGLWEEEINGTQTIIYNFNGSAVATRKNGSTDVTYLHGDHLGSISLTSGAVESQQEFDPWGVVHQGGIDSSTTTLNYTGQRRDDTGLLYYNARYYDPRLGRFLSPDSIVPDPQDPQDLNRYTYAKNNPVRYTDPTGHCAIICTALVGAAIGGGISYGTQVAANISQNGLNVQALTNVDGGDIVAGAVAGGVAGATGFVATGAVGSVLSGTGVVSTMAAGSAVGVVSGQVERAVHNAATGQGVGNGLLNPGDMVTDATIGAVSGGFGHLTKRVAQVGAIKPGFDRRIMAGHGEFLETGEIVISPKGTPKHRQFALNHERVHAFLTPKNEHLRNVRRSAYRNSSLWRASEETAAETFAHLRTGSGVRKSFREGVRWGKNTYQIHRDYGGR